MDGATPTTPVFQTPPRILIPKLVISRDGWKTKANERKKKLKAARIRIRDLANSRDNWKDKAHTAEDRIADLERQLEQARQDLATARDELKKKGTSLR
jgi:predicted  nucleic acid-binding Zn-ribbon protein